MPSDNVRRIFNSREAPKPALKRNPPARARPPKDDGVNWGQIVATTAVTALVSVAVIGFYQLVTGKVKDKLTPTPPPPPTPEPAAALPQEPGRMPKDQETQWVGGMIAPMQGMQNPPPGANPGYAQPQPQAYQQQYAMMPGMSGMGMQPTAMFPGAPLMLGPGMQTMQPMQPMMPMQMQAAPPAPSPTITVVGPPHLDRGDDEAPEWFLGFAKKNDRRMAKLEAALITDEDEGF